ncbi:MAG: hypothetical protein ABI318_10735 [Chthoniobacteraceae bacterium]
MSQGRLTQLQGNRFSPRRTGNVPGVGSVLLNGTVSQTRRGELAELFKKKHFSVMCAGLNAMGEGHSFASCSHLIAPSLSWALDENEQFPERIYRLDPEKPVTIYPMIMKGTIDEGLLSLYHEKRDSAHLALDGQLNEEHVEEVSLAQLLSDTVRSFDPGTPTVDERDIEARWPDLRRRLGLAELRYREWHPPITGSAVSTDDVTAAVSALALPSPSALAIHLARIRTRNKRMGILT